MNIHKLKVKVKRAAVKRKNKLMRGDYAVRDKAQKVISYASAVGQNITDDVTPSRLYCGGASLLWKVFVFLFLFSVIGCYAFGLLSASPRMFFLFFLPFIHALHSSFVIFTE